MVTIAVFWVLFVGWGVFLGKRHTRTGDPHYRRASGELMVIYLLVASAAGLHYLPAN